MVCPCSRINNNYSVTKKGIQWLLTDLKFMESNSNASYIALYVT